VLRVLFALFYVELHPVSVIFTSAVLVLRTEDTNQRQTRSFHGLNDVLGLGLVVTISCTVYFSLWTMWIIV